MSSTVTSDPVSTFLIGTGTPKIPKIYTGASASDIRILVCGTPYLRDLQGELAHLGKGDLVYIADWSIDATLSLPNSSMTFFQQLATLAQNVDVRVLLFNPYPANFAKCIGAVPGLGAAIAQAVEGLPTPTSGQTFRGYNWLAAIALRNLTVPPSSAPPLQNRVLLDYSGTAPLKGVSAQHQKAIVIYSSNTQVKNNPRLIAYVGGIDPVSSRLSDPATPTWHDVMLKLTGGAAADVLVNFIQRWNEASTLWPWVVSLLDLVTGLLQTLVSANPTGLLALPSNLASSPPQIPASSGAQTIASQNASVQIVRSFPAYKQWMVVQNPLPDAPPVPELLSWIAPALENGLTQVKQCLVNAINQANNFIYIEDQIFFRPQLQADPSFIWGTSILMPVLAQAAARSAEMTALAAAAARGVKIIILGAGQAEGSSTATQWAGASDWLSTELINPAAQQIGSGGSPQISINALSGAFVHAKVVIVDDLFALVGSANFADRSMIGEDVEMSAALASVPGFISGTSDVSKIQTNTGTDGTLTTGSIVQDLRVQLWAYHFGYGSQISQAAVWAQIADTTQSFGLWDENWGTSSPAIGSASPSLVINFLNTSASSGG